jgi:hypothetical protein
MSLPGFPNAPMRPERTKATPNFCTSDALIIVKGWVELTPRNTLIEFTYRKHYLCLDCHERWDSRKAALEHLLTAQDRRVEA